MLTFVFLLGPFAIIKIGQYPSAEDLSSQEYVKYKAELGGELGLEELAKANRRFNYNFGIGAFVYIRRIFEDLIEAHRARVDTDRTRFPNFDELPMDQKIEALKTELPPILAKTQSTYRILSKGVHELEEDECLTYFPVLRRALVAMLDQDHQAALRRQEEQAIEAAVGAISGKLSQRIANGP